jgi:hypothetical protein
METWCSKPLDRLTRPFGPPDLLARVCKTQQNGEKDLEIFGTVGLRTLFYFIFSDIFFAFLASAKIDLVSFSPGYA